MNIISLRRYKSELEIILHDNDIDIIGFSETGLDSEVTDSESIEGYRIYRNDRDRNGGGVAIYIRDNLPEPIIKLKSDKLELISLDVSQNIHARSSHLVCWYLSPTACVDEHAFENLRGILKDPDREEKEIILIGDTNCDLKCSKSTNAK